MKTSVASNRLEPSTVRGGDDAPVRGVITRRIWAGLLALVLGLTLLDRGFAGWRNDPRNFANADGQYPTIAEIAPDQRVNFSDRRLVTTMALLGAGLLVVSVVLLSAFGAQAVDHTESTDADSLRE